MNARLLMGKTRVAVRGEQNFFLSPERSEGTLSARFTFRSGRMRNGQLRGMRTWISEKSGRNSKGCDIGYALAANSCEGVNNVDACTVTALDAITAFAVPDPGPLLAESAGFFGSWCASNCSVAPDHPVYFGSTTFYFD